ncbi:MBL fold metallo-hydrolase [Rhodoplanes roseus]|uniref:Metallo-beta-lactamase domain-containing protein n=1 Tax=Rhodoplanes roseus TaxID=29409 RepID=A0A327KDK1_9BRAD|nr:MBL fold metallo-hydrolase [Rhodoplanes roseus]RAI36221.1 hypothetical protein CH341_30485 [Rhodoplanes roseus]
MTTPDPSRRSVLAGAASAVPALVLSSAPAAIASSAAAPLDVGTATVPPTGTHVVLLGTMGGPVLDPRRMMTGQAVVVDGRPYLVDCGYGTMERMTRAGLAPAGMKAIFITHHHSDHNADYPALVHMAWIQGIPQSIGVFGPPPMLRLHEAALAFNREDTDIRIRATGRKPIEASFAVRELTEPGEIHRDDKVTVTAALVDHPPFAKAFAFRFDTPGRSIVVSGDTAPSDALVALARGADVLVHEVLHIPSIDRMLAQRPYVPPTLRQFLLQGHTTPEECGHIAARAGVKTLVLSHIVPGNLTVPHETWLAEARKHFSGEVVVGTDLMVI